MKLFTALRAACAFVLASALVTPAHAVTFAVVPGTSPVPGTQNYGGSLGLDFVVGSAPIQLTHLGVWDSNQDGLLATIRGALYNTLTQALVIPHITFTTANSVLDPTSKYRFIDIPDLVLPPGFQGTIVAEGYNDLELNGNANTGGPPVNFTTSGVTYVNNRFGAFGSFPVNDDAGFYAAGNFQFTFIPEPSSLLLLGLGGAALLRRRKAA